MSSTIQFSNLLDWFFGIFQYSKAAPLMMGSVSFAVLFIIFLTLYILLKKYSRTAMLLYVIAFNLFFAYKANGCWMLLLPATAVLNYLFTEKMRHSEGRTRKQYLSATIIMDLALLCYFKYTNFILHDVLNEIFATNFSLMSIALPIGISFYTFQAISYAVDVYKRKFTEDVDMIEYVFYLSFFPLLLAGPITRAKYIIPRLKRNWQASDNMVWTGLFLVMLGLIKKNVVSDYLAQYNNWIFDAPTTFSGFEDLMAVFGYTAQIFLDFSGYSDMSIGIASILGFTLPDNFYFPYRSLSLTEFWRRWHISLSFWFRDYLYIPLGGNRKGTFRMYLNNFITMLVAGLWHGASWMFVIWGALHGFGLVVHKFFSRQLGFSFPKWANPISWLITYLYVTFAWTFFRAKNMESLCQLYNRICTDFSIDYAEPFLNARTLWVVFLLGTMLTYLVPERSYERLKCRFIMLPWIVKMVMFVVCVQLVVELSLSTVQPFIYYQF